MRTICRLLDIEQKGYITETDVEEFVRQLEESEAEDVPVIEGCLWRYLCFHLGCLKVLIEMLRKLVARKLTTGGFTPSKNIFIQEKLSRF